MRFRGRALWLIPGAVCLALYWPVLTGWYLADDFLWLYQSRRFDQGVAWTSIFFTPTVHGTWRPFSERLFLFSFERWFGSAAWPLHAWVLATQLANLWLAAGVAQRLTGWVTAGAVVGALWVANATVATVLAWACAYNYVLCATCLLGATMLLLRHLETGRWVDYGLQWLVFLVGFGVLETAIVYPALATAAAFLVGVRPWAKLAPLWAASGVFAVAHPWLAPKQTSGAYALVWEPKALLASVVWYGRVALYPLEMDGIRRIAPAVAWSVAGALALAIASYLFWACRKRRREPWFGLVWLLVTLAPVLPLRNQLQPYYLALPVLGLAWVLACGLQEAWRRGWAWRISAVALTAATLALWAPVARRNALWWVARSREARAVVERLAEVQRDTPNQSVLLTQVPDAICRYVLAEHALEWRGLDRVQMAPTECRELAHLPLIQRHTAPVGIDAGAWTVIPVAPLVATSVLSTREPKKETR